MELIRGHPKSLLTTPEETLLGGRVDVQLPLLVPDYHLTVTIITNSHQHCYCQIFFFFFGRSDDYKTGTHYNSL